MIDAAIVSATPARRPTAFGSRAPSWSLRRHGDRDRFLPTGRPTAPAPAPVQAKAYVERARPAREARRVLATLNDLDLLGAVMTGDDAAFQVFYERFRGLMVACVSRVGLRSGVRMRSDDLSDVLAEISLNMVAHDYRRLRLYRVDGGCSVSSWVGVIATSTAHDHLRKERRHRLDPTADIELERIAPTVDGPDCNMIDREQRSFVDAALASFSKRDRRFVELYFLEAMAPEKIATEMGVSVSTVYSKKAKIKTRLQSLAALAA